MRLGKIHIGTSGWSYGNWKKAFYPVGLKSADFLSYYSQTFKCTEINSSFYHLPRATAVQGWVKKVPKQFKFCPKMSRYITHIKRLKEPDEVLEKFFMPFAPIQSSLGPVLIQLPPSLKFDFKTASGFYELLQQQYSAYQFAVEGRHPSWLTHDSIKLMGDNNIAFVISQSGVGFPYAEEITAKNIYLRFHGPADLFKSAYTLDMLQDYAGKIAGWRKTGYEVWAFFNNTWFIDGVQNARSLIQLIEQI
jgi:uncharacterized protein YecE (DUF72 family)